MRWFLFVLLSFLSIGAKAAEPAIRLALNDLPGKGMLPIMVAVEHAKARGVNVVVSYLNSENIVIQAIENDLADVGMGMPYQYVQQSDAPLRMIFQLSKLAFHPVVNTRFFKDWKDLDGQNMYVHGRGSGTEAIVNILAQRHGIRYRKMHYLPGSGTRARAMLEERIKATVLDAERTRMLLDHASGSFARLPLGGVTATDEALFVKSDLVAKRRVDLAVLMESLLLVWGQMNDDPAWLEAERQRLGLLKKLTADEVVPYINELVKAGAYARDGGFADAAREDFSFYTAAGTLIGNAQGLKESEFWDFSLLRGLLR